MIIEIKFIQNPVLIISEILKYPDPKTTALGGVATGSINAHDAATVVATINIYGFTSNEMATGAKMGNNIAVVARFDVTSVIKLTEAIITKRSTNNVNPSNSCT